MDNASLISRDSISSTTPSRRHRFNASLTDLTKFLNRQDSKASLQSRATTSSGSSRWLAPWFPDFDTSVSDSQNGTTTTVDYPDRDPTRLQLVALTSMGTATSHKGVPCLPPGFPKTDTRQHIRDSNLSGTSLPLTLQEKALMSIARNVELYAKELERDFAAGIEYVQILHKRMFQIHRSERNGDLEEMKKQIRKILALATPVSIYFATYLFYKVADPRYKRSCSPILVQLCQPEIQKSYGGGLLCSTAIAFTEQPDRSSELARTFQQCLVDSLVKLLPHTCFAVIYARIRYCKLLVNIGDESGAHLAWERISFDNLSFIQDGAARIWLLGELGFTAWYLTEFRKAKEYCILAIDDADFESGQPTTKARRWRYLADCNYRLGLHETALAQATVARTILDGVNEVGEEVKEEKEEVQDFIAEIKEAILKKSAVATAPTLPHPTETT